MTCFSALPKMSAIMQILSFIPEKIDGFLPFL